MEDSVEPQSLGITVKDKECAVWVIVDEYDALQKVKQALRERGRSKKIISTSNKKPNNNDKDVAVECQKPPNDTITTKEDDRLSIDTPRTDVTLPSSKVTNERQHEWHKDYNTNISNNRLTYADLLSTSGRQRSNVTNERQQELHQCIETDISTNRLYYEDLLLTSARQQLEKQNFMSELLLRRQLEIDNAVHLSLTPLHGSNNIMVANNHYHRVNNYSRPAVASTQMIPDNNLVKILRLQNQDTITISDLVKKKNIENLSNLNDLIYGIQRNQPIDTTSSLVNERLSLLSNSSYFVPKKTDVVAAKATYNNGLNSIINHNNNNNIGMEPLLLKKKREIYTDIILASESFTGTKRFKTDQF